MGCAASKAAEPVADVGLLDAADGGQAACGGVLAANRGGALLAIASDPRHAPTTYFCNRTVTTRVVAPGERRCIELDAPTEYLDAGAKRVAAFEISRKQLLARAGGAVDAPLRVVGVVLMVEPAADDDEEGGGDLCRALEWVETPDGHKYDASAITALLADTGAVGLVPPRAAGGSFVLNLPPPPRAAECPGVRVVAEAARASVRLRLAVTVLVGRGGRAAVLERHPHLTSAVFRMAPPPPAAPAEVPLPLSGKDDDKGERYRLLRALLLAVPRAWGRVERVALQLDGRELAGVPGAIAELEYEVWMEETGRRLGQRTSGAGGYVGLCLPLSMVSQRQDGELRLGGELDLGAPAVAGGRLALRVTLADGSGGAGGAQGAVAGDAFVQACLLTF